MTEGDIAARIAVLEARIQDRAQALRALVSRPDAASAAAEFSLRVRRLAGDIRRERRPAAATPEQLAAWEREHTTLSLFREALTKLARPAG